MTRGRNAGTAQHELLHMYWFIFLNNIIVVVPQNTKLWSAALPFLMTIHENTNSIVHTYMYIHAVLSVSMNTAPCQTHTHGLYRDILPLFTPAGAPKRLLQRRQKAWCFSDDKILRSSSVAAARKVLVSHDGQVTKKRPP